MGRAEGPTGDPVTDAALPAAQDLIWAVRRGDQAAISAAFTAAQDAIARQTGKAIGNGGLYSARLLAGLLAGMVPDDRAPGDLLTWMAAPEEYLELRGGGYDATTAATLAADWARNTTTTRRAAGA